MSWISATCFGISALVVLSCFRREVDVFSPARVFILVWSFVIGLTDLKLSYFQSEWTLYAWFVLLLGISSHLLGLFVAYTLHISTPVFRVSQSRAYFSKYVINRGRLFDVTVLLFVAYMLCYVIEVLWEGYVPIFAERPDRARVEFGIFGFHLIVGAMPVILFLVVENFLLVRHQRRHKLVLGAIFFITAASFFFLLQRFHFVIWILMSLAFAYYTSFHLRLSRILLGCVMLFAVMAWIASLRTVGYVEDYLYLISKMKFSRQYALLTEPYMYIVMNLENFARGVEKLEHFTFGYFTGDFILALSGLKHWLAQYFHVVERPFLVSGFNTFPFLWTYYYDFGILGVAVCPFFLGMVIGIIYFWMKRRPGPLSITMYSFAFYVMVISFFTNPLTMLNTASNVIMLLLTHHYFLKEDPNVTAIHARE